MTTPVPTPSTPPQRDRLIDVAAAVVVLTFALVALFFDIEERGVDLAPEDIAFAVIGSGALLWRRSRPIAVMLVVVGVHLALRITSQTEIALVPAAAVAFYTAADAGMRRWAVGTAAFSAVVSVVIIFSFDAGESLPQEIISESAAVFLPVALGDAARSRRGRVSDLIEIEAAQRVQDERLRIARDLHDVVAHALSTIAVQSGVAAYNLGETSDDDPVKLALERINTTGKRSLEDLRTMVGVLRSTDDDSPLRPTPSDPDDLTALSEAASLAGIDLDVRISGSFPDDASDASVVAVHRIGQEALTNIARHAGQVPAFIELAHNTDHVIMRVVNQTSASTGPAPASSGVGIIGMRERAESLGGELTTTPLLDGGFEVHATIPYRAPYQPSAQ